MDRGIEEVLQPRNRDFESQVKRRANRVSGTRRDSRIGNLTRDVAGCGLRESNTDSRSEIRHADLYYIRSS